MFMHNEVGSLHPLPLAFPQVPCILRRFIAPCWGTSLSYAPFSLLVGGNMWG